MRERLAYVRIGVLGPLEVAVGGVPVEIAGGRLRALLVRLALDPGRYVGTTLLADGLWGDDAPADPGNALQSLVSRLRRALGRSDVLAYGPAGYRLALPPEAVDAVRFERQAHAGREALAAGDAPAARRLLEEALTLWRGPALADVADAPFAAAPAHRLEELRLEATEDRIEAGLAEGGPGGARPGAAVPELEALTVAHPLRERPRALLMRALYATGRQPEALGAYEEYRTLLAEELGADPSEALRELHVAVLRGGTPGRGGASGPYSTRPGATGDPYRTKPGTGPGAPDDPPPPVRTNLRAALTSFVGRDGELRRVRALLGGSRLVTLTGPGGAGKTRLATTAAEALLDDSPGGVWLVELAPVTGGDDVPFAVLGALGQRETAVLDNRHLPPRDVLTRLTDTLAAAPTTLVLDNCEHVVSAAAHLADHLLRRCPELRVLATSREPLGIDGEALCPVPPLSLPPRDAEDGRDARDGQGEHATGAAVRLFADRARAARPDFAVGPANAAAVAEICRRLDGLPLAIELAAARLRSLPVEQVAARLDNRFRLLTTGSRTALPRHRTLQAVVAWSWELLGDEERRLAEWLSVFPGGATPESVAGVCGMDVVTALDLLAALADKSLLQIAEAPQGAHAEPSAGPRYRMLETIREFGRDRLAEAGDLDRVRAAHAAHFLRLAETADPHVRGHEQLGWIALLDAEHDNLLAALRHAIDAGDAVTAVRLVAALGIYWMILGHHSEAADWLRLALAVPGDPPLEPHAVALGFSLINSATSGGIEPDPAALEELTALAARVDPMGGHPMLAVLEPGIAVFTDDDARGLAAIDERLGHPDPWTRALLRMIRAAFRENRGYAPGLEEDLEAAAAEFREVGDRWGLAMALHQLGEYRALLGDAERARAGFEEALRLMGEVHAEDDVGQLRTRLAQLEAAQGRTEEARAELHRVLGAAVREGRSHVAALCRDVLGDLARRAGEADEAARWYGEALATLRRGGVAVPQIEAIVRTGRALLACVRGDPAGARTELATALGVAVGVKDMPVVAMVGVGVATLAAEYGETATGLTEEEHTGAEFARAAELLGAADSVRGVGDVALPDAADLAARLRRALGAEFEPARARGAALKQGDAIELLRAYLADTPGCP
ncbi:AfsR/SARP family transcriptional regulator [Streptomyces sp. WAC 06738]|uniref:AfsR/SARP family transcriptional regulator n=1 Tax=Streptomyces sp. WAC 06738 TaxID=2203210 RepID=UPI000F6E7B1B|nr:BTAD domain-containing putative transcriptional regulator [Streptomyces sp. WAC 06738]AZM47010.1 AfsR/SARP family transcriptional regulator [Streptomyces sp. WAC 06738]